MFNFLSLTIPLAILLPNLVFFRTKPNHMPEADARGGSVKLLEVFEGIGRIGIFLLPVLYPLSVKASIERLALLGMLLMLGVYYCGWIRYFVRKREYRLLFAPLLQIPVPMALSPVLYFVCASLLLHSPWLCLGTVIFGIGHIPLSLMEYQRLAR